LTRQICFILEAGVHDIVWTATDTWGNARSCSFKVTVKDVNPPVFDPIITDQERDAPSDQCFHVATDEFDAFSLMPLLLMIAG